MKRLNNNGVATIMAVAILSLMIVTSLATIHMYLSTRAQHHGRIKKAYSTTFVMEDLSKLAYNSIESYANKTGSDCPNGTLRAPVPGTINPQIYGCFAKCPSNEAIPNTCTTDASGRVICLGPAELGTRNDFCDLATTVTDNQDFTDEQELWATTDSEELKSVLSRDPSTISVVEKSILPKLIEVSQAGLFINTAHAATGLPDGIASGDNVGTAQLFAEPPNCQGSNKPSYCQDCKMNAAADSRCQTMNFYCRSSPTSKFKVCGTQVLQLDRTIAEAAKVQTNPIIGSQADHAPPAQSSDSIQCYPSPEVKCPGQ